MELAQALAAFWATLIKPLLNTVPVEDLFAIAALDWAERNTEADGADKGIHEAPVLLFNILFA